MLPPHFLSQNPLEDLRSYVADYLKEEIAAEAIAQNIPSFSEFLRVAALTSSELLNYTNIARETGVDLFVILTGIERVYLDFSKPTQRDLDVLTVDEAKRHLDEGQFPAGSMGPKIRAAIDYIEAGGREVLITTAGQLKAALLGRTGTRIIRNGGPT